MEKLNQMKIDMVDYIAFPSFREFLNVNREPARSLISSKFQNWVLIEKASNEYELYIPAYGLKKTDFEVTYKKNQLFVTPTRELSHTMENVLYGQFPSITSLMVFDLCDELIVGEAKLADGYLVISLHTKTEDITKIAIT